MKFLSYIIYGLMTFAGSLIILKTRSKRQNEAQLID